MVYLRFLVLKKHSVHPSTSCKKKQGGKPIVTGPYGSWCTPEDTPKHAVITKTHSNIESKTNIINDDAQIKTLEPIRRVRLFKSPYTPKHVRLDKSIYEYIDDSVTELQDLDKLPQAQTKKAVLIEKPQSPVPCSKNYKGWNVFPTFCDPYMPIDPQGRLYISWLFLVTFCYSYNAWCIALRASFPYQTPDNTPIWMSVDYFCDIVYLWDVFFVKPRLMYVDEGFWVDDPVDTRRHYKKKLQYKFDVISLLPLDILYFYFGSDKVILRFPRLLKLQTFWEFHRAMDRVLSSPYVVRIGKTLFYIFYLIHLNACAYYAMSNHTGLASNSWVYDNVGNAYIRCFYFATKTATSIVPRSDNNQDSTSFLGKNPKPENTAEYLFMTAAWLMGVFVFALLIGQIRDIIATATRAKTEYRKTIDGCSQFMRKLNMPANLQHRVNCWFNYTWNQQRCFDEAKILNSLPYNMKRDVALEVHMSTLSKVQLFRNCSDSLLRDLVLQLRPVSYLPGDVVVRRGDVGHQMYIIKSGECYVLSHDGREVLATLREGSVFGEISLLGIDGLRRRTATVRSRGYSSLFALSRNDLEIALKYHKEAAQILRLRADHIIKENAARQARQKIDKESEKKESRESERRRKSAVSGDILEERRRFRSTSSQSKRKLSDVSEDESLSVMLYEDRNVVPRIIISSD